MRLHILLLSWFKTHRQKQITCWFLILTRTIRLLLGIPTSFFYLILMWLATLEMLSAGAGGHLAAVGPASPRGLVVTPLDGVVVAGDGHHHHRLHLQPCGFLDRARLPVPHRDRWPVGGFGSPVGMGVEYSSLLSYLSTLRFVVMDDRSLCFYGSSLFFFLILSFSRLSKCLFLCFFISSF